MQSKNYEECIALLSSTLTFWKNQIFLFLFLFSFVNGNKKQQGRKNYKWTEYQLNNSLIKKT